MRATAVRRGLRITKRSGRCALCSLASVLLVLTLGCFRPGALEELPPRDQTAWRPLTADEKEALRRRLADERILIKDQDVDAIRVQTPGRAYLEWSKPWAFRGAEVRCEFRVVRYRVAPAPSDWPISFSLLRSPMIETERLVWKEGAEPVLSAVGVVRYRWDLFIPDILEERHCAFYERQLDRHEKRHLLYAEELIRKFQQDGEDLVSRLLRASDGHRPDAGGGASGAESGRRALLEGAATRFTSDFATLRDRYWTAAEEEARVVRETTAISSSDRRDIEENCLAEPPQGAGK